MTYLFPLIKMRAFWKIVIDVFCFLFWLLAICLIFVLDSTAERHAEF